MLVVNLDKVYVNSIEIRFGKVQEHIQNIFGESAELLLSSPDKASLSVFDKVLKRIGIILHTYCEDLTCVTAEEEIVGQNFVVAFYNFLEQRTGFPPVPLISGYSVEYRIKLLHRFMLRTMCIYKTSATHQYKLLQEFRDAPGAYFDIDQRKIGVILSAPPKKIRHKIEVEKPKEEEEEKKPVILLNSKALTSLQMERFPATHFWEEWVEVENPDLAVIKKLAEDVGNVRNYCDSMYRKSYLRG